LNVVTTSIDRTTAHQQRGARIFPVTHRTRASSARRFREVLALSESSDFLAQIAAIQRRSEPEAVAADAGMRSRATSRGRAPRQHRAAV